MSAGVNLQTLTGDHDFYGVADNCFKLGDVVYEAVEDEDDGYRSCMEELRIVEVGERPFFKTPLARVRIERDPEQHAEFGEDQETWSLIDVADGHRWLKFGTRNTNDYYPWFCFEYASKLPKRRARA